MCSTALETVFEVCVPDANFSFAVFDRLKAIENDAAGGSNCYVAGRSCCHFVYHILLNNLVWKVKFDRSCSSFRTRLPGAIRAAYWLAD
jgi:hypothetical protein